MPACVQLTPKRVSLLCDAYSRILADTQQPPRTHPTATSGTHTPTHHGISVFCVPGIWITSQRHIAVLLRGNGEAASRQTRDNARSRNTTEEGRHRRADDWAGDVRVRLCRRW
mmetsp:Transcript_37928/g.111097  ORF Transcript_37928/g.111097 Transcript_37928/m.111097 type:complete len:113 (-) Transcript_37928:1560-1898(-)